MDKVHKPVTTQYHWGSITAVQSYGYELRISTQAVACRLLQLELKHTHASSH
jgi:hypothetical protein